MSPEQIALVQSSFARVAPIAPQAANIFYARLFEIAPGARDAWIAAYGLLAGAMADAAEGDGA
ncbi:MAG: hypothetical protein PHE36_09260 [Novosphingobium sp.]|nr:hypothetical protein [Novosphingobium sp.]